MGRSEMRIDVTCTGCGAKRRPIVACPACGCAGDRDRDGREWRSRASEIHYARIAAAPAVPALPRIQVSPGPVRVLLAPERFSAVADLPAIVPVDDSLDPVDARTFDWQERRIVPRLRRAA
jgi:hypothetical protein